MVPFKFYQEIDSVRITPVIYGYIVTVLQELEPTNEILMKLFVL